MKGKLQLAAIAVTCAALSTAAGEVKTPSGFTLKTALKQIDQATKDLRGVTADVRWDEWFDSYRVEGQGKIWVSLEGKLRGEVEGSNPRTILVVPPTVEVYEPLKGTADVVTEEGPDRLVQYALVGFAPAGSAMKRDYDVTLVRDDVLEGQETLMFTLVPKDKAARAAVSTLMLWVDRATWLPAQQLVRHGGGMQVTVRYAGLTPANDLPEERFRPSWPAGTRVNRK